MVVNGWFHASLAAGSGQYLAALSEKLPAAGGQHQFMLVRPQAQHARSSAVLPEGWQAHDVATPFDRLHPDLAKLWFEQVAFPLACHRLRADVGWTPYWGSPWWRPCPIVVTVHDLIPMLLPAYRGGGLQRAYTALVARTARRAQAVLTDSEASRRDIIRHLHIPPERVHAVLLGAARNPTPTDGEDVLARYTLPQGPFLLYLGGFDVRKNIVRMLEAYARLIKRIEGEGGVVPDLVLAGQLPATDSAFSPDPRLVAERLRITEHLYFTGRVDEAAKFALYRAARAVIFVSEYEGFGLPVLEAMIAPAPVFDQPNNDFDACTERP